MQKSLFAAAVAAAVLGFAAPAFAGPAGPQSEDEKGPPEPLPPLEKNFPLDRPGR